MHSISRAGAAGGHRDVGYCTRDCRSAGEGSRGPAFQQQECRSIRRVAGIAVAAAVGLAVQKFRDDDG
jgi:hypothetical protein